MNILGIFEQLYPAPEGCIYNPFFDFFVCFSVDWEHLAFTKTERYYSKQGDLLNKTLLVC